MLGKLFNSKVSAVSESDIEKRKFGPPLPVDEQTIKIATPQNYAGQFGVPQYSQTQAGASIPQWHSCRESFSGVFKKGMESFAFSHAPKKGKDIAAFFARFEDQLRLKKNRTFFTLTNKENVLIVRPSLWWRKYLIRRSLFTILLRSAQGYSIDKDNFLEALFSYQYANETKVAIGLFLKKYTLVEKKSINNGWRNTFVNKSEKDVLKILQKPPPPKPPEQVAATSENPNPKQETPVITE